MFCRRRSQITARHTKRFPRAVQNTMKMMASTPHLGEWGIDSSMAVEFTDGEEILLKLVMSYPPTWSEKFILILGCTSVCRVKTTCIISRNGDIGEWYFFHHISVMQSPKSKISFRLLKIFYSSPMELLNSFSKWCIIPTHNCVNSLGVELDWCWWAFRKSFRAAEAMQC